MRNRIVPFLSLLLVGLAAEVMVFVGAFGTEQRLITKPLAEYGAFSADRLWFFHGTLHGARRAAGAVEVLSWPARRVPRVVPVPEDPGPALWAVSPDSACVAWARGNQLSWECPIDRGSPVAAAPGGSNIAALGYLDNGLLAVFREEGVVEFWYADPLRPVMSRGLGLDQPAVFAAAGSYVGAASSTRLVVYRVSESGAFSLVERSPMYATPAGLALSAGGVARALLPQAVVFGGRAVSVPGPVRATAFGRAGTLFVAGDFPGVFNVQSVAVPQKVHDIAPGISALAVSPSTLAFAAANSVSLRQFDYRTTLNDTGRRFTWFAAALTGLGLMYPLANLAEILVGPLWVFLRFYDPRYARRRPKLPTGLLEAVTAGDCFLYAGPELGALSGLPTARVFAWDFWLWSIRNGLPEAESKRLRYLLGIGAYPAVIEGIVQFFADRRETVVEYFRRVYLEAAVPSRTHKTLSRIPFVAALTTAYDALLDAFSLQRGLQPAVRIEPLLLLHAEERLFFFLKLCGDPRQPDTVRLTRGEFTAAFRTGTVLKSLLEFLSSERTMFLVGLSIDDLASDLALFAPRREEGRQHYALVGMPAYSWRAAWLAAAIERRYGVLVLPFDEVNAAEALPLLLEVLASDVTARRGRLNRRHPNRLPPRPRAGRRRS